LASVAYHAASYRCAGRWSSCRALKACQESSHKVSERPSRRVQQTRPANCAGRPSPTLLRALTEQLVAALADVLRQVIPIKDFHSLGEMHRGQAPDPNDSHRQGKPSTQPCGIRTRRLFGTGCRRRSGSPARLVPLPVAMRHRPICKSATALSVRLREANDLLRHASGGLSIMPVQPLAAGRQNSPTLWVSFSRNCLLSRMPSCRRRWVLACS